MRPARTLIRGLLLSLLLAVGALAGPPRRGDFPGYGILPKEDTGADRFLREHPEYDGRGVVVAIFDTGVDPGAPGLQVTTEGKPKIIDLVDGSGSGDVEMRTVRRAEDGVLEGLSGRKLRINPAWTNPSGEYRLGLKRAYELFPGELVGRVVQKRREKWDAEQRAAVAAAKRTLGEFDAAHPTPSDAERRVRAEYETRLEELQKLQEKFDDPGPVFDCVVFHDGQVWRAVLDLNENGDLADEKALTDYRRELKYGTFSELDLLNYAVNIYDEGRLLSVVADSGAHGTHVAGIVAAYFPDEPELSGLAPGAQLVSVKIGDTRIGASSVGTGEVRGAIAALQAGCDLVNMSFGGPTADPDQGRTVEILSELVNRYGVIFVASAGNEGPALTTVGGPGATTSALLGVGACVSPEMMKMQYSLRDALPAVQFTWSSRGPTVDGHLGVAFSAPGAAIAPVPNWVLARNMLMNGTSMAAPNACGNIALLLSALKAEDRPRSPHRVRRALENTAVPVPGVEPFALGAGLIQVDRAYDYLTRFADVTDEDLRFTVRVPARDNARGIYLREPFEVDRPLDARVMIVPEFHPDADNRAKVEFGLRCRIETTASWIEAAEHLLLMHGGRRLDIRVDPTGLPPGAHYAELRGYDADRPDRGPVFRLPVTVVRPQAVAEERGTHWRETLGFAPGRIERRFLAAPQGATWADVRVRRTGGEAPRTMVLHTVQLVPGAPYTEYEFKQYLTLPPDGDEVRTIKVAGGRTLEVCLAQFWSSFGETTCEVSVTFHGVLPDRDEITLNAAEVAARVLITTPLGRERIAPAGSLDTLRRTLRPRQADLRPLDGVRDRLPEQRQLYELVLTYDVKLDEDAKVTPRVAMTEINEFEDSWQSQIVMIFDARRRLVSTQSGDPKPVSLTKGDYVVRFHVRYDDLAALDRLKDMALLLDRALPDPLALRFYADPDDALLDGPRFSPRYMERGEQVVLLLAGPPADKLPNGAQPGDLLLGALEFAAASDTLPGEGKRPGGWRVTCLVPPVGGEGGEKKPAKAAAADPKSPAEKYAEALHDFRLKQLAQWHDPADGALFDRVAAELLAERPGDVSVLLEQLRRADGKQREDDLAAVVAAADQVLAQIDREKLAAHFGLKLDPDDQAAQRTRQEMEKQRDALVEALRRKARALLDRERLAPVTQPVGLPPDAAADAFEETFAELARWVDTTTGDYLPLHIDRLRRLGQQGAALKLLNRKIADSTPDRALLEQRAALLGELGWRHWQQYEQQWLLIRFPAEYPPF